MRISCLLTSLALMLIPVGLAGAHPVPSPLLRPTRSTAYQVVARDRAMQSITPVVLVPGRSTVIDWGPSNERIVFAKLADPSQAVFIGNVPIPSGQATTLLVTPIQPLTFPGATTHAVTNLIVQTLDATGQQRLYTFNLYHAASFPQVGVVITPYTASPRSTSSPATQSTPSDADTLERGLGRAIQRGYTAANDPIVPRIRQVITQLRQGVSLAQASRANQVPLAVLRSLQTLAQESNP